MDTLENTPEEAGSVSSQAFYGYHVLNSTGLTASLSESWATPPC